MSAFARPLPTKLAAAVVAAGVASAGAVVELPDLRERAATVTAEVANASVVTDVLASLAEIGQGLSYGTATLIDAIATLPFDVAQVGLVALQDTALVPNLVSWLAQYYLNPDPSLPNWWTYAAGLTDNALLVTDNLPFVGASLSQLISQIAAVTAETLESALPDLLPGLAALEGFWASPLGRLINSANFLITGPVWAAATAVTYLGYLPADLEATLEATLTNPADFLGYVSWLADTYLSSLGMLGDVTYWLTLPVTNLPIVGDIAVGILDAVFDVVDGVLGLLPAPVNPYSHTIELALPSSGEEGIEIQGAAVAAAVTEDAEAGATTDGAAPAEDAAAADTEGAGGAGSGDNGTGGAEPGAGAGVVDETEDVEPPAEDAAEEAGSVRSAIKPTRTKTGNKFAPGSVTPDAGDAAGSGDTGSGDAGAGADDTGAGADDTGAGEGSDDSTGSGEE